MSHENNDPTGNQLLDNYKQTYGANGDQQQAPLNTGQPGTEQNMGYSEQQQQPGANHNQQPSSEQIPASSVQTPQEQRQNVQGDDMKALLQQQLSAQRETNSHLKFIKIFLIALAALYIVGMIVMGIIIGLASFGIADYFDGDNGHGFYYNTENGDYL